MHINLVIFVDKAYEIHKNLNAMKITNHTVILLEFV